MNVLKLSAAVVLLVAFSVSTLSFSQESRADNRFSETENGGGGGGGDSGCTTPAGERFPYCQLISVTLQKNGDGRGSLSLYGGSGGAFATCSPDCSSVTKNELIADAEYAVYATPETGSSFGGFTEGCSRVDDTYAATQNTYICYTGRHSSSFAVTAKFCKGTSCSSGGGSGGGGGGSGGGSGGGGGGGSGTGMCTPEGYVTTGPESQVKSGALGIMGAFKAYLGIDVNGKPVTHVGTPTDSSDAATKDYVDQAIARASGGDGGSGGGGDGLTGGCSISRGGKRQMQQINWGSGCKVPVSDFAAQPQSCTEAADSGYECGATSRTCGSGGPGSENPGWCDLWTVTCACVKKSSNPPSGSVAGGCIVRKEGNGSQQQFGNWGSGCKALSSDPYSGQPYGCEDAATSGYKCGLFGLTCSPEDATHQFCYSWTKSCLCLKN